MSRVSTVLSYYLVCLGSAWCQSWTCGGASCTTMGSVGIGTSGPGTTLDVAGNIRIANGSYLQGYSTSGSTAYNLLRVDSGDNLTLGAGIPYLTSLYSYGTETVRLSGNVLQINPSGGAATYYFQGGGINTASFGAANTTTNKLLIQGNNSAAGQSALKLQNSSGSVIFNAQNNGNVGVGTSSPGYKLDVQGGEINASGGLCIAGSCQASWPGSGLVTYNGNKVGIGAANPSTQLQVGDINSSTSSAVRIAASSSFVAPLVFSMLESGSFDMTLGVDGSNGKFYIGRNTVGPSTYSNSTLQSTALLTVTPGGNVGIGTTSPSHSLQVAGTIGAQEVIVSSKGADYVFDGNYKLASLSEVAAYIAANHHLPEIPSAEEMKTKGANLSEMQSKLLAKIEELTLHMIDSENRSARLERENGKLRRDIDELKERYATGSIAAPPTTGSLHTSQ